MILEVWFYFYLVKKNIIEQSPCDKIFYEKKIVRLCDTCTQKMENGIYMVRFMDYLRKAIVKEQPIKIQQLYVLDPLLSVLPDTKTDNEGNWFLIFQEFKKFGIRVEKTTKTKLV